MLALLSTSSRAVSGTGLGPGDAMTTYGTHLQRMVVNILGMAFASASDHTLAVSLAIRLLTLCKYTWYWKFVQLQQRIEEGLPNTLSITAID